MTTRPGGRRVARRGSEREWRGSERARLGQHSAWTFCDRVITEYRHCIHDRGDEARSPRTPLPSLSTPHHSVLALSFSSSRVSASAGAARVQNTSRYAFRELLEIATSACVCCREFERYAAAETAAVAQRRAPGFSEWNFTNGSLRDGYRLRNSTTSTRENCFSA